MSIKAPDRALSRRLRAIIERAERMAEAAYGERLGIVMVFAPLGRENAEMQYIANVRREDGRDLLQGLLDRWKAGDDVPAHEKQ